MNFEVDRLRVGRGTTRAEDAQGTPTQGHTSSSILVYEDKLQHRTSRDKDEIPETGLRLRGGRERERKRERESERVRR